MVKTGWIEDITGFPRPELWKSKGTLQETNDPVVFFYTDYESLKESKDGMQNILEIVKLDACGLWKAKQLERLTESFTHGNRTENWLRCGEKNVWLRK